MWLCYLGIPGFCYQLILNLNTVTTFRLYTIYDKPNTILNLNQSQSRQCWPTFTVAFRPLWKRVNVYGLRDSASHKYFSDKQSVSMHMSSFIPLNCYRLFMFVALLDYRQAGVSVQTLWPLLSLHTIYRTLTESTSI